MKVIILMLALFLCCKKEEHKFVKDLGVIIDATVIPTSAVDAPKMQIKTTKAIIVIRGLPTVTIGDSIFLYRIDGYLYDQVSWNSAKRYYMLED